jgi:predicted nucleic acid-binding protein
MERTHGSAGRLALPQLTDYSEEMKMRFAPCPQNAVLECALVGGAQFVITGDLDLLSLRKFRDIEIVRASEFLRRWQAGEIEK